MEANFTRIKIDGLEDYGVNEDGVIVSFKSESIKIIKLSPHKNGYLRFCAYDKKTKKRKQIFVHQVVAKTFIPNPFNLPLINHIDGNKLNNSVNNLEWCTSKENVQHAFNHGLMTSLKGESCPWSKLNWEKVLEIRKSNLSYSKLAKIYNVSKANIILIMKNKIWVDDNYKFISRNCESEKI